MSSLQWENIEKIEVFLIKAVKIGVALTLLVPLVLLGYFGVTPSDESSKVLVFQVIIEIILIFYLCLLSIDKNYLPKKSALLLAVFLFFLVEIITSFLGINFHRSFFGNIWRADGIFLHLHLLVFLIVIAGVFKEKEEWLNLLKISVFASGISSIAAVLQKLQIIELFNVEVSRLSGTLVNPGLFGNYIALSIFLAFFLVIHEKRKSLKVLWYSILALNFWALIFSGIRGAWVGAMAGFFIIFILQAVHFLPKSTHRFLNSSKKKFLVAFLVVVLVFTALFFGAVYFHEKNFLANRLYDILSLNLDDLRKSIWQVAWTAFEGKPLFGWGQNSFGFLWAKYSDGAGYANNGYSLSVDKPHNKILEVLVSGGIAGLLAYLSIFFILFYKILKYKNGEKSFSDQKKQLTKSVIMGFLVCYIIEHFFLFDSISTYILFFIVIGLVNNTYSNVLEPQKIPTKPLAFSLPKAFAFLLAIITASLIFYQINIKTALSSMHLYSANVSSLAQEALYEYNNVISAHTPYDSDFKILVMSKLEGLAGFDSNIQDDLKKIAFNLFFKVKPYAYDMMESEDQNKSNYYASTARIYKSFYLYNKNPQNLKEMENVLSGAIQFNPNLPVFYELMAESKILQGEYNEGENFAKIFYQSLPQNTVSERKMYMALARSYLEKEDFNKGFENAEKFFNIDYNAKKNNISDVNKLNGASFTNAVALMYYNELNDFKGTQRIYQRAMEIYPKYRQIFQSHLDQIIEEHQAAQSSGK